MKIDYIQMLPSLLFHRSIPFKLHLDHSSTAILKILNLYSNYMPEPMVVTFTFVNTLKVLGDPSIIDKNSIF